MPCLWISQFQLFLLGNSTLQDFVSSSVARDLTPNTLSPRIYGPVDKSVWLVIPKSKELCASVKFAAMSTTFLCLRDWHSGISPLFFGHGSDTAILHFWWTYSIICFRVQKTLLYFLAVRFQWLQNELTIKFWSSDQNLRLICLIKKVNKC